VLLFHSHQVRARPGGLDCRASESQYDVLPGSVGPGIRARVECLAQTTPGSSQVVSLHSRVVELSVPAPPATLQKCESVLHYSSFHRCRPRLGLLNKSIGKSGTAPIAGKSFMMLSTVRCTRRSSLNSVTFQRSPSRRIVSCTVRPLKTVPALAMSPSPVNVTREGTARATITNGLGCACAENSLSVLAISS